MDSPTVSARKRRAKFIAGSGVIGASVAGLLVWAMARPGATSFYYTPSELRAQRVAAADEVRVSGNVVPDSVERKDLETAFDISDGKASVRIVTEQALPDAFWTAMAQDSSAVEVVAQGRYDGGTFAASRVLAKCPSKFKAKA